MKNAVASVAFRVPSFVGFLHEPDALMSVSPSSPHLESPVQRSALQPASQVSGVSLQTQVSETV